MDGLRIRTGGPADGPAIAALHAASWQTAYAHILSEAYRQTAPADRLRMWQARMSVWDPARMHLAVAERGSELVGFGCVLADAEPDHGALLDNLHIRPDLKGGGVGRLLLTACAQWVAMTFPGRAMHLTCYVDNAPAARFYRRMGGVESAPFGYLAPDGTSYSAVRFSWAEPGTLAP
jgi:GNAT superfamily N-acetyltransferase